jgi:hypothetical protein
MNPVMPLALHENATLIVFAKDQPPYVQLPASVDGHGTVMTEWELTAEELAILLRGGRIRLWVCYTGVADGKPLTPLAVEAVEVTDQENG